MSDDLRAYVRLSDLCFIGVPPQIESAPRQFRAWGYDEEQLSKDARVALGEFEYSKDGELVQTFELEAPKADLRAVTFEFFSNHGHSDYTCKSPPPPPHTTALTSDATF